MLGFLFPLQQFGISWINLICAEIIKIFQKPINILILVSWISTIHNKGYISFGNFLKFEFRSSINRGMDILCSLSIRFSTRVLDSASSNDCLFLWRKRWKVRIFFSLVPRCHLGEDVLWFCQCTRLNFLTVLTVFES